MSSNATTPLLRVDAISAGYDDAKVIDALSFDVETGEIVSLLGPSGCGKTTALRAVAGFQPVTTGTITIAGRTVSTTNRTVPPEQRSIGMVFQDYALFPHLNVADNIAFGLHHQSTGQQRAQVGHLLEATGLDGMGGRFPHELSGGQQQRVALARALAPRPTLLLMDEPFSNLDVDLRERLSIEVRDLLKHEGISGILVTHDQHEAFAVSDKVGIMHHGRILQWDTPHALYHQPAHRFVADFIGQGRFISGVARAPQIIDSELGPLPAKCPQGLASGARVEILIRPGDVVPDEHGEIAATVKDKAFKGAETLYLLELSTGTRLLSLFPSHHDHRPGDAVRIRLNAEHLICFPATETTGNSSTETIL
jgi:iron(III) transport system ATP-binding protein